MKTTASRNPFEHTSNIREEFQKTFNDFEKG